MEESGEEGGLLGSLQVLVVAAGLSEMSTFEAGAEENIFRGRGGMSPEAGDVFGGFPEPDAWVIEAGAYQKRGVILRLDIIVR